VLHGSSPLESATCAGPRWKAAALKTLDARARWKAIGFAGAENEKVPEKCEVFRVCGPATPAMVAQKEFGEWAKAGRPTSTKG
jgi:hypothetical protein